MTVTTSISNVSYPNASGTGPYAFSFRVMVATQLVVTSATTANPPVVTTLVNGVDYTVSGLTNRNGGSVTLLNAPVGGPTITIARIVPLVQLADFRNQGSFFPEDYEDALDYVTWMCQEIASSGGTLVLNTGGGAAAAGPWINVTSDPYNAKGDGVTDNTAAFNAAITAAAAQGLGVFFPPGTYLCTATSVIDASIPVVFGCGDFTTLKAKAGFSGSAILQYGANEAGAPKEHTTIRGLRLDGNGQGVDGIVVYKAQNLVLDEIHALGCRNGIFCDDRFDLRILNILLKSCYTGGANVGDPCTVGYKFDGTAQVTGSFDTFWMESCASESDVTGVWITGVLKNRLVLAGCEIQDQTVAGIHADGAVVALVGTYIETATPSAVPGLQLVNGAIGIQDGASSNAYPSIDATSQLIATGGANVSSYRYRADYALGAYDVLPGAVQPWGPPNYPVDGRAGSLSFIGQIYTDGQGVRWIARTNGSTAAPPYSRWDAMDGEIRIPIDLTAISGTLWWPQNDFLVESVDFVVTETAVGGNYITMSTDGTAADTQEIFDQYQGAIGNLVAGNVLSAAQCGDINASLVPVGKRLALQGGDATVRPANFFYWTKDGVFSAGAGTLIIRGHYPQVGTRGTTALLPNVAGGTRTLLGGWSQASPMAINTTGQTAVDAVASRGRTMVRAGSLTAISARLTAAKTAGTLVVIVSHSSDNGATWTNFAASVNMANSVFEQVSIFAPGTYTFLAGDMLRVQWTTDAGWLPTVNTMDVSLEVTQ